MAFATTECFAAKPPRFFLFCELDKRGGRIAPSISGRPAGVISFLPAVGNTVLRFCSYACAAVSGVTRVNFPSIFAICPGFGLAMGVCFFARRRFGAVETTVTPRFNSTSFGARTVLPSTSRGLFLNFSRATTGALKTLPLGPKTSEFSRNFFPNSSCFLGSVIRGGTIPPVGFFFLAII